MNEWDYDGFTTRDDDGFYSAGLAAKNAQTRLFALHMQDIAFQPPEVPGRVNKFKPDHMKRWKEYCKRQRNRTSYGSKLP